MWNFLVECKQKNRTAKSLTLDVLKPILSLPDITFIDLQYNDTKKEKRRFLS